MEKWDYEREYDIKPSPMKAKFGSILQRSSGHSADHSSELFGSVQGSWRTDPSIHTHLSLVYIPRLLWLSMLIGTVGSSSLRVVL